MYKKILQVLLVSIYCINLTAQSFTPIGTVDPSKYVPRQKEIAFSDIGMVTTQHFLATEIGEDIIKSGGNAYDASVAIGFALAVVLPRAGNIGGGGFMVIHDADLNANFAIDYRERAPRQSSKDMYLDDNGVVIPNKSTLGYLSSGVPGTVAGLWSVHQKFGSMDWEELLAPAIKLAKEGFEVTPYMQDMLVKYHKKLSTFRRPKKYSNLIIPFLIKHYLYKKTFQKL
jgi:gamma-glutamyltranspeptidase/glutathione hydrolase